jgi:photosynthetic reaction center cytochrome c subunit
VLVAAGAVTTYKSTAAVQAGYPGTGMQIVDTKERLAAKTKANIAPPSLPPASQDGKLAVDAYKNVQVLGHLSSGEFTRLMTAMTMWVAPNQGCAYCHAHQKDAAGKDIKDAEGYPLADQNNLQSDELYTKKVARRMLQMTMHINSDWNEHVKATGVTCFTCHRGNPVPQNIWYDQPEAATDGLSMGGKAGQNSPAALAGLTSLPGAPLRPYLAGDENIRIQSNTAIGSDNRASIKQTEWTYALMIHMSNSLGVNCTFCHNTRSMGEWSTSPATRATAWHGIRMVRDLNKSYLEPLLGTVPPERLGALGDPPKASCATCHAGAYRPLLGVSMLKDYTALAEAKPQPEKTVEPPVVPAVVGDGGAPVTMDGSAPLAADGGAPLPLAGDAGAPAAKDAGAAPKPGKPAPRP